MSRLQVAAVALLVCALLAVVATGHTGAPAGPSQTTAVIEAQVTDAWRSVGLETTEAEKIASGQVAGIALGAIGGFATGCAAAAIPAGLIGGTIGGIGGAVMGGWVPSPIPGTAPITAGVAGTAGGAAIGAAAGCAAGGAVGAGIGGAGTGVPAPPRRLVAAGDPGVV